MILTLSSEHHGKIWPLDQFVIYQQLEGDSFRVHNDWLQGAEVMLVVDVDKNIQTFLRGSGQDQIAVGALKVTVPKQEFITDGSPGNRGRPQTPGAGTRPAGTSTAVHLATGGRADKTAHV